MFAHRLYIYLVRSVVLFLNNRDLYFFNMLVTFEIVFAGVPTASIVKTNKSLVCWKGNFMCHILPLDWLSKLKSSPKDKRSCNVHSPYWSVSFRERLKRGSNFKLGPKQTTLYCALVFVLLNVKCQLMRTFPACNSRVFLWQDGLVFRIKIMHYREMVLLQKNEITQELKTDCGKKAKELEREITHLPLLTSTLHGYVLFRSNLWSWSLSNIPLAWLIRYTYPFYSGQNSQEHCIFVSDNLELFENQTGKVPACTNDFVFSVLFF